MGHHAAQNIDSLLIMSLVLTKFICLESTLTEYFLFFIFIFFYVVYYVDAILLYFMEDPWTCLPEIGLVRRLLLLLFCCFA